MTIYPAIDILAGQCVRLYQGNFNQRTTYSDDPLQMAQQFFRAGAKWLHVVDLSGAKDPNACQYELIRKLIFSSELKLQIGGGIRTKLQIQTLLNLGVERVMLGSIAVRQPEQVVRWSQEFGVEKIMLTLDISMNTQGQPMVATSGWQQPSNTHLFELIAYYQKYALKQVLCTDIACDGTLAGPNFTLYQQLVHEFPGIDFIASGGVCSQADIVQLQKIGLAGCVIGKALYENQLILQEIL